MYSLQNGHLESIYTHSKIAAFYHNLSAFSIFGVLGHPYFPLASLVLEATTARVKAPLLTRMQVSEGEGVSFLFVRYHQLVHVTHFLVMNLIKTLETVLLFFPLLPPSIISGKQHCPDQDEHPGMNAICKGPVLHQRSASTRAANDQVEYAAAFVG